MDPAWICGFFWDVSSYRDWLYLSVFERDQLENCGGEVLVFLWVGKVLVPLWIRLEAPGMGQAKLGAPHPSQDATEARN